MAAALRWIAALILLSTAAAAQPAPTFTADVAPILAARCAGCHRAGGIGPFALVTYDDVKRHAAQVGVVTARRLMPPWKPAPGMGEFQDERRLTDRELDTLQRWIAAGAPRGEVAPSPSPQVPPATADAWQLGAPDLVVRMPQPYVVPANGADVFRTFVIPIPT
ncbi:MAG: hypothetical protein DMF93_19625, partial [Acidobacteria bacterium]